VPETRFPEVKTTGIKTSARNSPEIVPKTGQAIEQGFCQGQPYFGAFTE
jgi:hypothetical protein